jgi:hypothetical protein
MDRIGLLVLAQLPTPNFQLLTPNFQLLTPNSQLPPELCLPNGRANPIEVTLNIVD